MYAFGGFFSINYPRFSGWRHIKHFTYPRLRLFSLSHWSYAFAPYCFKDIEKTHRTFPWCRICINHIPKESGWMRLGESERWIDCSPIPRRIPVKCKPVTLATRHSRDAFDVGMAQTQKCRIWSCILNTTALIFAEMLTGKILFSQLHESVKITLCRVNKRSPLWILSSDKLYTIKLHTCRTGRTNGM